MEMVVGVIRMEMFGMLNVIEKVFCEDIGLMMIELNE